MEYVIAGAGFLGFCAFMGHGDEGGWFEGTLKAIGLMVLVVGVILLAAYLSGNGLSSLTNDSPNTGN